MLPALPAAAEDSGTAGEKITSYDVRLAVQRDGSLKVEETIASDFGTNARHGIERDIDTEQRYDGSHNRRYRRTTTSSTGTRSARTGGCRSRRSRAGQRRAGDQGDLPRRPAHAAIAGPALAAGGILLIAYALTRPGPRTEAGEIARAQLLAFTQTLAGMDPARYPAEQREAARAGLLPYAVVLGLAPQLASAFVAAGVVAGGYAYTSDPMWWSTFATDATSATNSSSSSSGGSGFDGGASGGGGGGGGGGSW